MRFTPVTLAGATTALALVALPALAVGQSPKAAPAPPPSSGATIAPMPTPVSSSTSTSSGGSSGVTSSPSRGAGGASYGGSSGMHRGGGGQFGRSPSGYSPGGPGRGAYGSPPTRVALPAPGARQPGGMRGYEPVRPGGTPGVAPGHARAPVPVDPRVPRYARPVKGAPGSGAPGYTPPGRVPFGGPGRVELPGRVQIPGVVGLPERPGRLEVAAESPRAGDNGDTRLLPPPITPVIGRPIGKPLPKQPVSPPPAGPSSYYAPWYYQSWLTMPSWAYRPYGYGDFASCYPRMMTEEDEYWARVFGHPIDRYGYGCGYGYGYGYGGLGYWGRLWMYGQGWDYFDFVDPNLLWLNLMPCAVVTAETYSGRRYSILTMLPEFGAYGPMRLRNEIQSRLRDDGEITIHGRGSQELHLFDGFVKRINTRWCGPGEW